MLAETTSGECVSVDMLRRRRSLKPENQRYYSRDWYRRAAVAFRDEADRLRTQLAAAEAAVDKADALIRDLVAKHNRAVDRRAAAEAVCRAYQNYLDSGSYVSSQALSIAVGKWQALRPGDKPDAERGGDDDAS